MSSAPMPPARGAGILRHWGGQLLQQSWARIVLGWCLVGVAAYVVPPLWGRAPSAPWRQLQPLVWTALSLAVYYAYVRLVERRRVSELDLHRAGQECAAGLLLGTLAFTLVMLLLIGCDAYRILGYRDWSALPAELPRYLQDAITEELLFRAILFRILEQRWGSLTALLVSALLFGALHLGNPGASLLSAAAIAIEAGLLLAAAYMLTRRLWLCTAIHLAWNYVQGAVYSVAVSGTTQHGLLIGRMDGPDWLTGGSFGAEASLPAVLVCGAAGLILLRMAHRTANAA